MYVKLSKSAEESLAYIIHSERKLGQRIYMQLSQRLPLDPYPDACNQNETFHSTVFKALEKQGFDISRLKSSQFIKYRVFYIVDEDVDCIYILDIVERNDATYKLNAKHIENIKRHYIEYYQNRNK